jgi:hypothetical protein
MEAENDVMKKDVIKAQKVNSINVSHMEEENVVANQIVIQAQ